MALDKSTLKNAIEAAFTFEADKVDHPEDSRSRIAQALADAIDVYIKAGLVTVNTVGTSTAQHGTGNIT